MTTEEKAKAYDAALERARKYMAKGYDVLMPEIFPELRESEDKRIRKAIEDIIHVYEKTQGEWIAGYDIDTLVVHLRDAFAYLEKQKEHHIPWYDYQKSKEAGYTIVPNEEYEQLIKQKEQKPVEIKIDNPNIQKIELLQKSWYTEGYYDREFNNEPKWIIKTGEGGPRYEENPKYGQPLIEQRPTEEQLHNLNEAIKSFRMDGFDRIADSLHSLYNCILKTQEQKSAECSVKGRRGRIGNTPEHIRKKAENFLSKMEPPYDADDICSAYETGAMENIKQEWSEDDIYITNVLEYIVGKYPSNEIFKIGNKQGVSAYKICSWLKSLRPVSKESLQSWKPSEDEERLINTSISFLKDFADKGYENAVECIDWLKSKLNGNTCK